MIPKSLHTITALAKLGAYLMRIDKAGTPWAPVTPERAALAAAVILGYAGTDDTYGLIDKAAAVIAKGAR